VTKRQRIGSIGSPGSRGKHITCFHISHTSELVSRLTSDEEIAILSVSQRGEEMNQFWLWSAICAECSYNPCTSYIPRIAINGAQ